ncbi:hypothetical protein [Thermococcus thioreducens]|uniref:Uncharacterized protein n=1 Tax=Thermococcus thioreducens TaxID=277988 RepID=A0A0Q2M3D0_9EURY|nr:hypothetical protein [Thermococcus thioreducens]ASJ11698.1 hypothetical protein A3L14_01805 [Thermococcus thioreducens]KQH82569.1 hypothetical protein AMR53_04630 [Thermococcus thioreducens]
MIVLLSLIISSSALGWTVVSIALGEMKKDGTSMLASILTDLYLDILIPTAVFLYFGHFLGKLLGREKLESIGIPALIGSFLFLLTANHATGQHFNTLGSLPRGDMSEGTLYARGTSSDDGVYGDRILTFYSGWAFATAGDNKQQGKSKYR